MGSNCEHPKDKMASSRENGCDGDMHSVIMEGGGRVLRWLTALPTWGVILRGTET